jgi:DNA-binding Lrp family transcriptional regulator
MGLFTNIEQLNELITSRIRSLEGVRDVETSISVHNVKYEVGIARITDRPPRPSE